MSRLGIIQSVSPSDRVVNFIGYGEYIGETHLEDDLGLGVDITISEVLLDSGKKVQLSFGYWADEEIISKEIENYKNEGYKINQIWYI